MDCCCGAGLGKLFGKKSEAPVLQESKTMRRNFFTVNSGRSVEEDFDLDGGKLGEGGFGSVRKVKEKRMGVVMVMKSMLKETIPDVQLFQNEVGFQSMCDHPHIARLHETYEDRKMVYIIMETCDGGHILEQLDDHGFGELDAWHIFSQLTAALYYLHDTVHLAHRDLKPENFLIKEKGLPLHESTMKLIDFGFAQRFQPGTKSLKTRLGTPFYMCPEILQGDYDEKCDMWSSGVILYLLLCGELPFYAESTPEILEIIGKAELSFKEEAWADVDPSAQSLIRELISLDPDKRPSAEEVMQRPWLKRTREEALKAFPPSATASKGRLVGNLKQYSKMNAFQKTALTAVARVLQDEDIAVLRRTFESLDAGGDGRISLKELKKALAGNGTSENDIAEMCRGMAVDGEISYSDFLSANIARQRYLTEANLWEAFRIFDKDGNGEVDLAEFKSLLQAHVGGNGIGLSEEKAEELFKRIDTRGDAKVDFDEFLAAVQEGDLTQASLARQDTA